MTNTLSTGQAAALLGTTEPRINDAIRRGKLDPAPLVAFGRRHWKIADIQRAAEALGIDCPDLSPRALKEVARG